MSEPRHAVAPLSVVMVSCSWCHAMNALGTQNCSECDHKAGLPRMLCDCERCASPLPQATAVDVERALSFARSKGRPKS